MRAVRIATLVAAGLAGLWAIRLVLFGGFQFVVGSRLLRSHDLARPFEAMLVFVAIAALAGGWSIARETWRRAERAWPHIDPALARRGIMFLVAGVFALTVAGAATTVGGADTSGYVSQADRWLNGNLTPTLTWAEVVPWPNAPWTFTPLGYTPSLDGPPFRMAPIYAPGLPLMLAGAKLVGGQVAMGFVPPICCAILVLATYGIGRRLIGPFGGLTAAWLVSTSPILLVMSMSTMSDVPAGAGWASAFYFLVGEGAWAPLAAGLAAAVAILIRPNLVFLAAIMGVWFLIRRPANGPRPWRGRARDLAWFGAGSSIGAIAIGLIFNRFYGSPFQSGYGGFADYFEVAHVWPNLVHYARHAMATEPVLVIGSIVGFLVPGFWPRGDSRRAMLLAGALAVAVVVEYSLYIVFDEWMFVRFFLVVWPFVAVAAAGPIAAAGRRSLRVAAVATVALGVAGVWGVSVARDRGAFDEVIDRHYAALAKLVADVVPPGSAVFSMQHSGSLRYYSGRVPIRWDFVDADWLDKSVDWLAASGAQSYLVVEDWEADAFRKRFQGQAHLAALDTPVLAFHGYRNRSRAYIYDLSSPPPPGTKPAIFIDTDPGQWRDWPPGPEPTLNLHPAPWPPSGER